MTTLSGICKEIQQKGMPPFSYRILHEDLQLKPQEIASICSWSQPFRNESQIGSWQSPLNAAEWIKSVGTGVLVRENIFPFAVAPKSLREVNFAEAIRTRFVQIN